MAFPHEPHFLKPLLPGFNSGLNIPLTFFSKHVEGNHTTWKLRSNASDKTWEVIQEGRRLTGGWQNFSKAHNLRIGDIVVFKKDGDMVFHVTPFGLSCCEIKYTPPHMIKEEASADDAAEGSGAMSSFSFEYCFLAEVTASNIKEDKLHLPVEATRCTALNKQCQEVILVNKEGNSWTADLLFSESWSMYYIRGGWTKFCRDNICDIGDLFVSNMDNCSTDVCMSGKKECSEILREHLRRKSGELCHE